jgi:hypothetical protein
LRCKTPLENDIQSSNCNYLDLRNIFGGATTVESSRPNAGASYGTPGSPDIILVHVGWP